jgi:hypothetical protein
MSTEVVSNDGAGCRAKPQAAIATEGDRFGWCRLRKTPVFCRRRQVSLEGDKMFVPSILPVVA